MKKLKKIEYNEIHLFHKCSNTHTRYNQINYPMSSIANILIYKLNLKENETIKYHTISR